MTEVLLQENALSPGIQDEIDATKSLKVQYSLYDIDEQNRRQSQHSVEQNFGQANPSVNVNQYQSPPSHNNNDDNSQMNLINDGKVDDSSNKGTVFGSTFNLIVAVVGAGILSFPFAFRESGLLLSILILCIASTFAFMSLKLLVVSTDYIKTAEYRAQPSFRSLALECGGGDERLANFTQFVVILSLFGSMISRIVGAAGIIVILYYAFDSQANEDKSSEYYKLCIVIFTLFPILPLSLLRNINSLRFTSLLSVCCSIYLTIVLTVSYFLLCDSNHYTFDTCVWDWDDFTHSLYTIHDHKHLANFSSISGVLTTFPIFVFGYNCQPNVFGIYKELKDKTVNKMMIVVKSAITISFLLYIIGGSFAYLTFLDDTCGNILLNRFHKATQIVIAAMIFTISMVLATPVFVNVIRKIVVNFLLKDTDQAPIKMHVGITIGILFLGCIISVFVSDIATVFGFIGCTTNPITGYILPTYFFWKLVPKNEYTKLRYASLFMSVAVILISVGSFVYKIYAIAEDVNPSCDQAQDLG